jgi:hypothetical protein
MKVPFCDWDEAAKSLTIRVPGGTVVVSRDKATSSEHQVMGGFVLGRSGLETTLIIGGENSQLVKLEIKPNTGTED